LKYLRKYVLFESNTEIDSICQKYGIQDYTINGDGTVDVDGDVDLSERNLSKLPLKFGRVTGNFNCQNNKLTTLEGCPREVSGDFYCNNNQITIIKGELEFVKVPPNIENNPIQEVYQLFSTFKSFQDSLDYNYFRSPNQIVKNRFEEACEEAGIKIPKKIKGYQYI
jgi:hypothetical protein